MRHLNLRSYLESLKREGELHIIDDIIDPHLELAEIQRRMVARQGPALLFTRIKDTDFPVATNLFGTRRRLEMAFGQDPGKFIKRVSEAASRLTSPSLSTLWEFRDLAKNARKLGTRHRRTGAVMARVSIPRS